MLRLGRRIFAAKGVAGTRPAVEPSRGKVRGGRLMLVGVDVVKSALYDRLARGRALRFSDSLPASYYEQLASERKVVRYVRGQPVRRWERKPGMRAEALDCAQELQRDPWDFAVEVPCLRGAGLSDSSLRWLLCKGYAEHAIETKPQREEKHESV